MSAPERIWVEKSIAEKGNHGSTAWHNTDEPSDIEYVRADRAQALEAENARLRDERDDAIDTLNAWFDRRKLAHESIDEAVLNAARGYLRTSRSGGMDKETSDMIEGVIEDMARLAVFADLFARAAMDE